MISIFQIKEKESEDFCMQLFGYQMRIYMWKA